MGYNLRYVFHSIAFNLLLVLKWNHSISILSGSEVKRNGKGRKNSEIDWLLPFHFNQWKWKLIMEWIAADASNEWNN